MRRHTTQIEGKICAVLAGSMHFLGQWVRLHMAITLLDVLDHIAQHHRCEFVPEAQREDVNGIAIEHIRWRLQSSKHVSESAGGWFFSIGPSVLIGLFFFLGGNFRPRLVRVLLVLYMGDWWTQVFSILTLQLERYQHNARHFKLKALPWASSELRNMDKCHSLAIQRGLHVVSSHVISSPVCIETQNWVPKLGMYL